jgi:hypothetical protein
MDTSIFLSKALGLYLLIVGLAMLLNPKTRAIFLDMMKDKNLLYVSEYFSLIIGILIVVSHNIWVADWRIIITLVGWVNLVKGTLRIAFPNLGNQFFVKWLECNLSYYTTVIAMIIGGAIIYYLGCVHSQLTHPL